MLFQHWKKQSESWPCAKAFQPECSQSIGWWLPARVSHHPGAAVINQWAKGRDLKGVVWTALKPKIGDEYRVPTSPEVIAHLGRLQGGERAAAEEYIRLAPGQIVTPYRRVIEQALGWTATDLGKA